MAFCEQCGTQLGSKAAFCGGCGASVELPASTLSNAPLSQPIRVEPAAPGSAPDDPPKLSEQWQRRFAAIEKAGGERTRWWRWPEVKTLTSKEKRLITWNLWAFAFGPFYYLYLGMWRKAITLSIVAMAIGIILGMVGDALDLPLDPFLWIVSAIIFKQCANVDYYRKVVLKRREWW